MQLIVSPETRFFVRQRNVIKALLPELKALKERGMNFERIAENLQGLKLKATTIREYYYEEIKQQNQETLHETALRYKQAADEGLKRAQVANGKSLEDIVNKAISDAAAKSKPALPLLKSKRIKKK